MKSVNGTGSRSKMVREIRCTNLFVSVTCVFHIEIVELCLHIKNLMSLNCNITILTTDTSQRLMVHDSSIRQQPSLSLVTLQVTKVNPLMLLAQHIMFLLGSLGGN